MAEPALITCMSPARITPSFLGAVTMCDLSLAQMGDDLGGAMAVHAEAGRARHDVVVQTERSPTGLGQALLQESN